MRRKHLEASDEAIALYQQSDVIDLHIDTFIWSRIFGYDLAKHHTQKWRSLGRIGTAFYNHVDFPRAIEGGLSGATWIITTNPLRSAKGRAQAFVRNIERFQKLIKESGKEVTLVRNMGEYRQARAENKHAVFVGIQGGNALDESLDALDLIPDDLIIRITLVHLSNSKIGVTSSPLSFFRKAGLTDFGREYVARLNQKRILVDLAHISPEGFFDAVEVHDKSQPLIVTHTGISGRHPHWRNLSDEQIKAIADTGGTIGIMYHTGFLSPRPGRCSVRIVVDHIAHVIDTVGEDHVSLGSDWDGMIMPPADLTEPADLPRLVQAMLNRKWSVDRIQKVLGLNFLRVVESLRG